MPPKEMILSSACVIGKMRSVEMQGVGIDTRACLSADVGAVSSIVKCTFDPVCGYP